MRLHRRLTLTMAVLLVIGLAVADFVTYTSLHSFLYGRLDAQLDSSQTLAAKYLTSSADHGHAVNYDTIDDHVNEDVYVVVLDHDGRVLASRPAHTGVSALSTSPAPIIRVSPVRAQAAPRSGTQQGAYRPNPDVFTLSSTSSNVSYRAAAVPGAPGHPDHRGLARHRPTTRCRRCCGSSSSPRWSCWSRSACSPSGRSAEACDRSRTWPGRPERSPRAT